MSTYAANTDVSSDRSMAEIKRTLERYGADSFGYMEQRGRAQIAFEAHGLRVRFELPLPDRSDSTFTKTPTGRVASPEAAQRTFEQAVRQRWRALALVVKAKLEAVESQISTFEQEFYAHMVLPSGRTVFEETSEQVHQMVKSGDRGPLMIEAGR